jgi:hypothetical protein
MLSSKEAASLLSSLCSRLGFCLPGDARARLTEEPPPEVHQFTAAVFMAEGLEPPTAGAEYIARSERWSRRHSAGAGSARVAPDASLQRTITAVGSPCRLLASERRGRWTDRGGAPHLVQKSSKEDLARRSRRALP